MSGSSFAAPDISRHLLREEGEVVVDEVSHHWIVFVRPVVEAVVGLVLLVLSATIDMNIAWVVVLLAFAAILHAGWAALREQRDRFVITNMRIFRIHGVLSTQLATMPLARVLDITVAKPFIGRIFGYGHFIFESAAQEQGLKQIRYVGAPDERDLIIQRVVQRAGLRGQLR